MDEIRKKAYGLYQLDWMAKKGYTIEDVFWAVLEYAEGSGNEDRICDKHALLDLFSNWESDEGFGGELWVCFEEFLGAEYLDVEYMKALLPFDLFGEYYEDCKRLTEQEV